MRIPSFSIQSVRGVALAKCEHVPPLMIIAGPNGCGKSTLLNTLRKQPGPGKILYVGPHRTSRRQRVQHRYLLGPVISLYELLAGAETPRYEGVEIIGGARDAWGFDETTNYVKYALSQVEIERQQAIALRYDRTGEISKGAVPDIWTPLRELTTNLLPHLLFREVDTSDRTNMRVNWQVHGRDIVVDLDELSSGEKSIIQMFYPLIEHRIRQHLKDIRGENIAEAQAEICLLIDEPELHLHPNLQLKVLDYLRVLAAEENIQIIVTTQSVTVVENATFEELFLLRPSDLAPPGENQLVQVASEEDRLGNLRNLFGTTANLTSMQPIIIVEGKEDAEGRTGPPDRKLYRALHENFDRVTIVSGGGKGECIKLRQRLSEAISTFARNLRVVALLDRDISEDTKPAGVLLLPVSMIENLLIDPDAIWEAIQSVVEKTPLKTVDDVEDALTKLLDNLEANEIDRHVIGSVAARTFRASPPLGEIRKQAEEHCSKLLLELSHDNIAGWTRKAQEKVQEVKEKHQRRELFNGKLIANEFYKQYLHNVGLPKSVFLFETARHARRRKSVRAFFDKLFQDLLQQEHSSSAL